MQILLLIAALGLAQEAPLQIPPPAQEAPAAPAPAKAEPQTRPATSAPVAPPAPASTQASTPVTGSPQPTAPASPLSFYSESFSFVWDRTIPLTINLDGLKVSRIFFNKRIIEPGVFSFLKGAEFGTRAQVSVTNTSKAPKVPGFAVAVMDKEGRLLGVASGGTKIGTVAPGGTETFDLNFTQVNERLASGDKFLLAIELRN